MFWLEQMSAEVALNFVLHIEDNNNEDLQLM